MNGTFETTTSHVPLLLAAVCQTGFNSTGGAVVELGSGFYSTPVLQSVCISLGRPLLTIESDREWLNKHTYEGIHKSILLDSWDDLHRYGEELVCDVAFIDVAPASARGPLIHVMRRWAKIIVVHDTEPEQQHVYPGVEEALQSFKYRIDDKRRGPWTSAVSDTIDVQALRRAVL